VHIGASNYAYAAASAVWVVFGAATVGTLFAVFVR
jgi:hypothetical protein